MKRSSSIFLYIGIALLICPLALAEEEVVLYSMHFPPYSIDSRITPPYEGSVEKDGLYGADIELIRAAYASQGVNVVFKTAPWKRTMRNIKEGLVLGVVSCRPITPRSSFSYFSDAVSYSTMVLATQKDYLGSKKSHPLSILTHHKNTVMAGWAQESILTQNGISYSVVNGISQGVSLVLHRNQDIFMTDKESLVYVLEQMEVKDQMSLYNIDNIDYTDYTVCFSKRYPHSERLRRVLNKGLKVLRESGEMQALYDKYGITNPHAAP